MGKDSGGDAGVYFSEVVVGIFGGGDWDSSVVVDFSVVVGFFNGVGGDVLGFATSRLFGASNFGIREV